MRSQFEVYLRTGRTVQSEPSLEFKFNPWHDPEDGRFTFANGRRNPSEPTANRAGGVSQFSPKHPRNHSIYTIRKGDTLGRIAATRKGLRVSDLAELNGISPAATLRPGQRLIVANHAYLDAGRRAKNNIVNLAHYMDTHGGRLPPNPARAPTIAQQLNSDWQSVAKNGYAFKIDALQRSRRVEGEVLLQSTEGRSRRAQSEAGKPDRRRTDDGGHIIAARFNGPRDWFNHFAQDASFNRGANRVIEDGWAKEVRAGKRVFVDISPQFRGASRRPYKLIVKWYVNSNEFVRSFPNEQQGR